MVDSCQDCDGCREGQEQGCSEGYVGTYNGKIAGPTKRSYIASAEDYQPGGPTTWGGYSTKLVVRQEFAISIPDSLSMEQAVR
jgi:uncharacterized zinc-type alcohol dehydrogenase-like protein